MDEQQEEQKKKQELSQKNNYFLGRLEIMFDALAYYHEQDHAGKNPKEKLAALNHSLDEAAAANERLDVTGKAKAALEWQGMLGGLKPEKVVAFIEHDTIREMAGEELPNISRTYDFGVDLNTLREDPNAKKSLIGKLVRDRMMGRKPPSLGALQTLEAIGDDVEKVAKDIGLFDDEREKRLTKRLDAYTPGEADRARMEDRIRTLQTIPVEVPEEPMPKNKTGALPQPSSASLESLGRLERPSLPPVTGGKGRGGPGGLTA